jgi:predicted metal-dependent enzyme (double-stranded beta helix superfamily)
MFDANELVADLRSALRENVPQLAVRDVLARAMVQPLEVLERALGPADDAEVRPLWHAPDLTVLKVVWAPGMTIAPHDHRLWAVIGVYGGVEHNRYFRRVPTGIEQAGGRELERGNTAVLGDEVIHAVRNPRDVPTATIHVYGGDFFGTPRSQWDEATQREIPSSGERTRELFRRAHEERASLRR